ncbi:hypothetical protein K1719_003959 [Acacia pycnantha]|nr:hypothetical protein K1719_003959 [Acacia pycnantha]
MRITVTGRRAYIIIFISSLLFVEASASDQISLSELEPYFHSLGYDTFSLGLQSALRHFQTTYGLNATGELDEATAAFITQPRCGVPDFLNGTSTMPEGGTASFKRMWRAGKKEFTYAFSPDDNVWDKGKKVAFVDAFDRWSKVTEVIFTESPSFNKSDIQITFVKSDVKTKVVSGTWFDPATARGGVYLDEAEKWVLPTEALTEADQVDIESVAMHQIGHMLGFSHTPVPTAVMFPYMPRMQRKLDFTRDESEMIHRYSKESYNGVSLPPFSSPATFHGGAAGGVRRGWELFDLFPTVWLVIALFFWF